MSEPNDQEILDSWDVFFEVHDRDPYSSEELIRWIVRRWTKAWTIRVPEGLAVVEGRLVVKATGRTVSYGK